MAIPLPLPPPLPLFVELFVEEGGTCAAFPDALLLVGLVLAVCLVPADDLTSVEDLGSAEDFVSVACWGSALGLVEAWPLLVFADTVLALAALLPPLLRRRERLFLAA
ncbi:hypothetical protein GME_09996 [Halomonas sp. TD01]|nr:hypothetical protein GME_09996 [Halomonas sp. TD01]